MSNARSRVRPPFLDVFGLTDRGLVRSSNQDQFVVAELQRGLCVSRASMVDAPQTVVIDEHPQGYLLAVADGVGGNAFGDVASAVTIDAVAHEMLTAVSWSMPAPDWPEDGRRIHRDLASAVRRAQQRVRRISRRYGLSRSMSTTLTMVYVTGSGAHIAHAGDSRCYLKRNGRLRQLTNDHTLAAQVLASSDRSIDDVDPRLHHVLVNAVGGTQDDVAVESSSVELELDEQLLLCTDGLTMHIDDDELCAMLSEHAPAESTARALVAEANERGGVDNVTVILARAVHDAEGVEGRGR